MNKLVLFLGAVALLAGVSHLLSTSGTQNLQESSMMRKWVDFKTRYGKAFNSVDDEAYRFKVFVSNVKFIEEENKKVYTYTLGENQLMDITREEFKGFYLTKLEEDKEKPSNWHKRITYPDSKDWTETEGAVQKVKDQGQCGSCWAFSAIGATESAYGVFKKHLGDFSEQQLVDCSSSYGNHGCNGGLMNYAFKYIQAKGITTEEDYPYVARDQRCQKQGGDNKITGYTKVPKKVLDTECKDLKSAIAQQPVAVGVDAEQWQFYSGGVFNNCGKQLDHGVLAVGYTADSWKIKNSWSSSWGEKGFIRLAKGNTCGVCNTASYPSV